MRILSYAIGGLAPRAASGHDLPATKKLMQSLMLHLESCCPVRFPATMPDSDMDVAGMAVTDSSEALLAGALAQARTLPCAADAEAARAAAIAMHTPHAVCSKAGADAKTARSAATPYGQSG